MQNPINLAGVILCLGLLFVSCTGDKDTGEIIPAPEEIISAHTSGVISRESSIGIRFVNDIVDTSEVNLPLTGSQLIFEPELEGVLLFSDKNRLEFRPAERLPAGQTYHVTVFLADFVEGQLRQDRFSFEFTVMTQSFTVNVEGLQIVDEKVLAIQQLNGRLLTADAEYASGVEQLLIAEQAGRELPISWRHDDDQRMHVFVVDSVFRGDDSSLVLLEWDGDPIGVDLEGRQEVVIPPVNTFSVTQFRAVQDREQYVEIRFSDPVQKDQSLGGLITVEKVQRPRFSIDGNVVRVYNQNQWIGDVSVTIAAGVQNSLGQKLRGVTSQSVSFPQTNPALRFVGQGVIVPGTEGLTVPFEAVNLRAVVVEATPIAEGSMSQFLQVNDLKGGREMRRVGRVVWKETVPLDLVMGRVNEWIRYGLDVRPLVENHPAGLYHLTLSFQRRHVMYPCRDTDADWRPNELWQSGWDSPLENSNWEAMETAAGIGWREMNEHRNDPCHPAYYKGYWSQGHTVSRNVLMSDMGLIAKKGANDSVLVVATDIGTTKPLSGVDVTLYDYAQTGVGSAVTDGRGMAVIHTEQTPFLLVAKRGDQTGYLRLADGTSLSVSHFDVAGESVAGGFKGFLYGERGVWRPGDSLFITFLLMDKTGQLPLTHPLRFELHDSRGQLVTSFNRKQTQNGCYVFRLATSPDAPTGNWKARVKLGGATFEKKLKIETVMPNRLKVNLDFGDEPDYIWGDTLDGSLSAAWLHGAPAKQLKSDIEVTFASTRTRFEGYDEFVFDDQAARFRPESHMLWEGNLDDTGYTSLQPSVQIKMTAPGMLRAAFRTRVYEPGGAFSVDYSSKRYHPFTRYVGLRVPRGDRRRGMLLTDTTHTIKLAMVDRSGEPVSSGTVEVKLYRIHWRWWWEKGDESPADYIGRTGYEPLDVDTVRIKGGLAEYDFRVNHPNWGRFLVRARDLEENHQTGKIFYADWPGWAGRARKDAPGAANVLTFSSDKEEYQVGEQVVLNIPTGQAGRALVSIESGSRVVKADWIEAGEEPTRYQFAATEDMAPNVYAHVTFVQPHLQAGNDLPIRMYGVIPIKVTDPGTKLAPMITAPSVLTPSDTAEFAVSEASGRAMTYTVAIVDEGLLDLTRFPTPDPWNHFYRREALGVKTWDLFDMVAGAYGGKLEQLLAIGGGESAGEKGSRKANRFVPMVRFMGPFALPAQDSRTHRVDIPQYVGSVRMMVVAGRDGAFGATEKTMPVRKPLMILGTLPRSMVTEETVDLPISVFALEPSVNNVDVSVDVEGALSVEGATT
ncbi:MAG: MG2 domain-containing protein, partial [candidate division Zixibacteria bacterium]|nr:MG2 domain-containing protein [candidate division Zixibacteria bacterium]